MFSDWSLWMNIGVFAGATAVIAVAGVKLSHVADRLADRTGWGEAVVGALLLGGSTSLAGSVVSVTAAWQGQAQMAISNGIGGIAAQSAFLAIADMFHREANLEHAAASLANILFGSLVIALLGGVMLAATGPAWTVWSIHPVSPLLLVGYIAGLRLAQRARTDPMWQAEQTSETRQDQPQEQPEGETLAGLWTWFGGLAVVLGVSGWIVAQTGMAISQQTGVSGTVVGAFLTAVATSTPELVTSIAAVRRGALTLAVGGILGGNAFDVMFAVASDVAYREGSVYHAITDNELYITTLGIVMTAILVMGMLRREKRGLGNIGFESAIILALYLGAAAVLIMKG